MPTSVELLDVWSRTGPKYRIRAIALLTLNVLLFSGVGVFAFWIRSGEILAPTMEGYWDQFGLTMQFTGPRGISLGSLLLEPISVRDVPMQIPILGLLMAALISIPILVSILYRFWASLPFIAIVGFLAVMPWLAITLLGSCVIASVRPFRTPFRFMSALIGLAPAVVYLFLAYAGTSEIVAGRIDPMDYIKFVAPWVLAIVASTVVFAIVLSIARAVDYRPGAITPLLALMFGLPVGLFERHVGRDELHYRLLESLTLAHFEEVDTTADLQSTAERAWERHPLPRPRFEDVRRIEEEKWQLSLTLDLAPFQLELTRNQQEIVRRCKWFHHQFPHSRHAVNVYYLHARAMDMRIDAGEFRRSRWIRYHDEFPSVASRKSWRMVAENEPDSVLGLTAEWRLAQFEAREGEIDRATARLEKLLAFPDLDRALQAAVPSDAGSNLVPDATVLPKISLRIPWKRVRLNARRLHQLLVENNDPLYQHDPIHGAIRTTRRPVFGLLDLDPRHDRWVENLKALRSAYPDALILDNIELEIALSSQSLTERQSLLQDCIDRFPDGDAAPEILLRLAATLRDQGSGDEAGRFRAQLVKEHPDSMWAKLAESQ